MRPHCSNLNIIGCFKSITKVCLTLWLPFISTFAQPEVEWERTYEPENGRNIAFSDLVRDENGGYSLVGINREQNVNTYIDDDICVLYLNNNYEPLRWIILLEDLYSDDERYYSDGAGSITISANGDLLIAGWSRVRIGTEYITADGLLIRLNPDGELLSWNREQQTIGIDIFEGVDGKILVNDGFQIVSYFNNCRFDTIVVGYFREIGLGNGRIILNQNQTITVSGANLEEGIFCPSYANYGYNGELNWSVIFQDSLHWKTNIKHRFANQEMVVIIRQQHSGVTEMNNAYPYLS